MKYNYDYRQMFSFDAEWNFKTVSLFIFLLIVPNILGMLNISTPFGFKLHFFQLGIFMAAMIYGPMGGLLTGIIGSAYSAILMSNPYILLFNAVLGFFAGVFYRKNISAVISVLLAFMIELPILMTIDYYIVGMPMKVMLMLVFALFVSNVIWAIIADKAAKPMKNSIS
ncbi:MAG: hypothetical protein KKF44_04830 [Nanoarchaeota archaeon]|nr:hypothetical protein [Nanoarchaeota archaeon]